jgi:hypothetical protein
MTSTTPVAIINQIKPVIAKFSIQALIDMSVTTHGDQANINQKNVDKILDSLVSGNPLYQALEVTKYKHDDKTTFILTGGRNRLEALKLEYQDNLDAMVYCIQYTLDNAAQIADMIVHSNGSRRMVTAEKKELQMSARYGFNTLTADGLADTVVLLAIPSEKVETFKMLLSLLMVRYLNVGQQTAYTLASAVISLINKTKLEMEALPTYDVDGVQLNAPTVRKLTLEQYLTDCLTCAEAVMDFAEAILNAWSYIHSMQCVITAKDADYIMSQPVQMVVDNSYSFTEVINEANRTAVVTFQQPEALQRNASKYVRAIKTPFMAYLKEVI